MPTLELKPTHKVVAAYYDNLAKFARLTKDDNGNITSDPNRMDDEQYIVRLLGQVITVSLETLRVVKAFPEVKFD